MWLCVSLEYLMTQNRGLRCGAAKELKVMVYWNDYEGMRSTDSLPKIVNNIDMRIIDPSNVTQFPWILNPDPLRVNDNATKGIDTLNNSEQITIISFLNEIGKL